MTARKSTAFAAIVLSAALVACQGDAGDAPDTARADASATATADTAAAAGGMLDPNSATRDQLAAVQGMTEAAADTLIARRPYDAMTKVDAALSPQLDSAARKSVYAKVWMPINLNTASDAEILMIPGIGSRMLREFKEYRPYTSIEQFRREIGKYVDAAEVARLEQYVSVR